MVPTPAECRRASDILQFYFPRRGERGSLPRFSTVGADGFIRGNRRRTPRARRLGGEMVVAMKSAEHRASDDIATVERRASSQSRNLRRHRSPLANALMRSCLVEEPTVFVEQPLQVCLIQDKHMVNALSAQRPNEPFHVAVRFGARIGVRTTLAPAPSATASNSRPNFASLSRKRNLGPWPNNVSSRSCCASHSLVVAARRILRATQDASSRTRSGSETRGRVLRTDRNTRSRPPGLSSTAKVPRIGRTQCGSVSAAMVRYGTMDRNGSDRLALLRLLSLVGHSCMFGGALI
jgi:hypothetical protein